MIQILASLFSTNICYLTTRPKRWWLKTTKWCYFSWFWELTMASFCFTCCQLRHWGSCKVHSGPTHRIGSCFTLPTGNSAAAIGQGPQFVPALSFPCGCLGFLIAWWLDSMKKSSKRTNRNVQVLFKLLLAAHLLISHWPKLRNMAKLSQRESRLRISLKSERCYSLGLPNNSLQGTPY